MLQTFTGCLRRPAAVKAGRVNIENVWGQKRRATHENMISLIRSKYVVCQSEKTDWSVRFGTELYDSPATCLCINPQKPVKGGFGQKPVINRWTGNEESCPLRHLNLVSLLPFSHPQALDPLKSCARDGPKQIYMRKDSL